jgi:hypothetical protein
MNKNEEIKIDSLDENVFLEHAETMIGVVAPLCAVIDDSSDDMT